MTALQYINYTNNKLLEELSTYRSNSTNEQFKVAHYSLSNKLFLYNRFMSTVSDNNKRIAKNTLILYARMFLVMFISLYTSRIILKTLGISDFGIFNVVGGVVMMMNVVNSAMSVSTQRYLTFELGKKDYVQFTKTFSMCMNIFFLLCVLILVLGETVGLWFVNTYLIIPQERMEAANWVYQFSLLSCMCTLLSNPYNATIISHERMNVYAYIGITEVFLKLAIVYVLQIIQIDRLTTYGVLTFISSLTITLIYRWYCVKHFAEVRYSFYWNRQLFKQLASYSGWNLFGSLSGVAKGQGLNILINIFFGPSVNAARGIAYQVNGVIQSFFSNFYTAVRPQITKYYAQGNKEDMFKLIFNSSKMAFFLILFISLPLVIETPFIIQLWLGQMPEYVVPFVRLVIVITAIDSMSTPLMTAIHATGNNRLYQFSVGLIMIMTLPISYIFLKSGYSPLSVFVISLVLSMISLFVRLGIAHRQIGLPFIEYTKHVVFRSFLVPSLAFIIPAWLHCIMQPGWIATVSVCSMCVVNSLCFAFFAGLSLSEQQVLANLLKNKLKINK